MVRAILLGWHGFIGNVVPFSLCIGHWSLTGRIGVMERMHPKIYLEGKAHFMTIIVARNMQSGALISILFLTMGHLSCNCYYM